MLWQKVLQATRKSDAAESMLKTVDKSTQKLTGISLCHLLPLGSIGASIALYLSGKQKAGIFIGLWERVIVCRMVSIAER